MAVLSSSVDGLRVSLTWLGVGRHGVLYPFHCIVSVMLCVPVCSRAFHSFLFCCVYSFDRYLLSTYYVLDSVLGAGVTTWNKARSLPQEFSGRLVRNNSTTPGSGESCENSGSRKHHRLELNQEGAGYFQQWDGLGSGMASLGR